MIKVENFESYFKKQQADSNCGFAEEYEVCALSGERASWQIFLERQIIFPVEHAQGLLKEERRVLFYRDD